MMGESGFFFREVPRFAGAGIDGHSCKSYLPAAPPRCVPSFTAALRFSSQKLRSDLGRGRFSSCSRPRRAFGFSDSGCAGDEHLEYYRGLPRCGGRNEKCLDLEAMTTKKKLKLLKCLLSEFPSSSNGVGLVSEVEGMKVSEAAEILIKQLQQVRVKEKEIKRNKKLEKAKTKSTGLSESSSSSDSDCESKEVINMGQLRNKANEQPHVVDEHKSPASICCSCSSIGHVDKSSSTTKMKCIEVCMGKKCKTSGGAALLDEFEKVLGNEGAVVGSKCMGKCRYGPNVRVPNSSNKSILIGVDAEDVPVIAANFNQNDVSAAAS